MYQEENFSKVDGMVRRKKFGKKSNKETFSREKKISFNGGVKKKEKYKYWENY